MSSSQRQQRRISSRLHDKDDAPIVPTRAGISIASNPSTANRDSTRSTSSKSANDRKRKMNYDEDDDGFLFTRVKKKKPEPPVVEQPIPDQAITSRAQQPQDPAVNTPLRDGEPKTISKKRGKRLSFSTPKAKDALPPRRSKRLSREHDQRDETPAAKDAETDISRSQKTSILTHSKVSPTKNKRSSTRNVANVNGDAGQVQTSTRPQTTLTVTEPNAEPDPEKDVPQPTETTVATMTEEHSATKISLPFADTPVIKRNKAMREGKHGKGERRSSLGLRGRRASSLIETGHSNALPHNEVEIPDFYKHIESEIPEPRRMRQLLTWCGTRALDEKPMGTGFEDSSVRSAARVIEEELLKDLANRSELSDWFSREDVPVQQKVLPERPNPKNDQNLKKITELEIQIKRLRAEKEALESLLRPPSITSLASLQNSQPDRTVLADVDVAALDSISLNTRSIEQISTHVNSLFDSLGPTVDKFADGVHKVAQYREAADNLAGRVLSICAERLEQRQKGKKPTLSPNEGESTPPKDLGGVLRSLSRVDR